MRKQTYIVKADGWVAGTWCSKGQAVALSDQQAKYETNITPEPAPKKQSKSTTVKYEPKT